MLAWHQIVAFRKEFIEAIEKMDYEARWYYKNVAIIPHWDIEVSNDGEDCNYIFSYVKGHPEQPTVSDWVCFEAHAYAEQEEADNFMKGLWNEYYKNIEELIENEETE